MFITEEYREQNRILHERHPHYGVAGKGYISLIRLLAKDFGCSTFLDYGCGKRTMQHRIPELPFRGYDPAIEEFSGAPDPAEFIVCLDVLEHVEPEFLDAVLDHLQSLTEHILLMSVSCRLSQKLLPDGRNSHLIVEPMEWWLQKIMDRWKLLILHDKPDKNFFYAIVRPKEAK